MAFKVQVGPPKIANHHAMTVLVTEPNGESWGQINGGAVHHDTARIYLTNREFVTAEGTVPRRTLSFVLSRHIDDGPHEDLDIVIRGPAAVLFNLEVMIWSDSRVMASNPVWAC